MKLHSVLLTGGLFVAFASSVSSQPAGGNYDEAKIPAYTLPDPLIYADGTPVTSASAWKKKRRPELGRVFE